MGVMGIVTLQIVIQTRFKILGRGEIAPFQKATSQDTKPQLHLIEPCAMFGRQVEHMFMARIAQEGPTLHPAVQVLRHKGHVAPLRDQTTDLEAPVRIEMIHHPIVALHLWELLAHMGQMGGKIGAGARLPQMPPHATCRDHKRGNQCPDTMTDVLVFAFFWFARFNGLGGVCALQNLHTGLFIGADDHTALLTGAAGMEVNSTNGLGFGLKVRVVAVEPIDTTMGFQVCLIEEAPDTRTTHGPDAPLLQDGAEVVETPARGRTVVRHGFTGGRRQHCETL